MCLHIQATNRKNYKSLEMSQWHMAYGTWPTGHGPRASIRALSKTTSIAHMETHTACPRRLQTKPDSQGCVLLSASLPLNTQFGSPICLHFGFGFQTNNPVISGIDVRGVIFLSLSLYMYLSRNHPKATEPCLRDPNYTGNFYSSAVNA